MKQVHNIRVRVHNRSRETVEAVLARADAMARKDETDIIERKITEEEGLYIGELWLDRQQPVRRFLTNLLSALNLDDKASIRQHPSRYVDVSTHCHVHCAVAPFLDGKIALGGVGGSVSIRLNLAAFPATKENARVILQTLFA